MKKVLLGLLALSAVTMAKPSDLTQAPAAGGTVFEATQEGAIGMTGSLISTIPTVKYVIYASADNGTTKEDVLQLTDFIISEDVTKTGFVGVNPKVYVKRVVSTGSGETYGELDSAEIVEYKIRLFDYNDAYSWKNISSNTFIRPTNLVKKVDLEGIIAKNSILTGATISQGGVIVIGNGSYFTKKEIYIRGANGALTFDTSVEGSGSRNLTPEQIAAIEDGFKAGLSVGDVKLQIRIK